MNNSQLTTYNSKLLVLIAVFVALASLYSFVVPLGEGPDEPGHAGYVFFLARERRLPDQRADEVPGEGHQPPLAYALAAPLAAWLPAEDRMLDWPANPRFTWAGPAAGLGQARELNALAHGSREFWPWRGTVLAWHMARLASVALGVATVVLTYLAARELNCRLQVADCRVDREQSQATSAKRLCAVPLLAAALVAFNPQFLFLSALVTNDALLAALSALVLWLAVGHAADHRPPTTGYRRMAADPNGYALLLGLVLGLALLTKQSALLLAPVALISAIERSWRAERRLWSARHLGVLGLFAGSALLVCGWWYWRNLRLYGDLFGLSVFRAEFATQAFDARSPAAWADALVQLHESFWGRFGWMNLPAPAWAIGLFAAIELAALVGWVRWGLRNQGRRQAERETSRAGNRLVSRISPWLYLLLLPALALAWVVSFALTAGLVAWQGRLLFPALPAVAILLALGLRLAGSKQVAASGKRGRTAMDWLLPVAACLLAFWLPFGVIGPAYPAQTLPEAVALARLGQPTYARLGRPGDPGAELLGWQVGQPVRAGAAAELTLMWYARGRQARDWTVFVHLVDANDQIVAEDNQRPRGGAFPTTQWVVGDWVEDRHTLNIPAELPPGAYRLRIGLFDERTQERAGVFSRGGRLLGDHHLVGNIQIE